MGDYFRHLQQLKAGMAKTPEKETKGIAKVSEKKKAQIAAAKPEAELLEEWFEDRSKEMTGKCVECGEKSCKGDPVYWKFSICHILPKKIFKSVKRHPLNFIELCHFGKSHHNNFDTLGYEWAKEHMPKAWEIIVQRFKIIYPAIVPAERKNIPDILLQELEP